MIDCKRSIPVYHKQTNLTHVHKALAAGLCCCKTLGFGVLYQPLVGPGMNVQLSVLRFYFLQDRARTAGTGGQIAVLGHNRATVAGSTGKQVIYGCSCNAQS